MNGLGDVPDGYASDAIGLNVARADQCNDLLLLINNWSSATPSECIMAGVVNGELKHVVISLSAKVL